MRDIQNFGTLRQRSNSGALLSVEIEKLREFLRQYGLLIAKYYDNYIVVSHPFLIEKVKESLIGAGLQPVVLGATLANLRESVSLTVAENRVFELLSPGSLIVVRDDDTATAMTSIAVPDNNDLRDICCTYGGSMLAFIWKGEGGLAELERVLGSLEQLGCTIVQLGFLESPIDDDKRIRATVIRIFGEGNVDCIEEGTITMRTVKGASTEISQWEIGEWT